ncbi:23S rRNA (uracil-C(5))-methyltransferase RlmCD [Paenibacillus sp. J2TS4]|nr:23S rRNA (uracil-C(5))-methyltransferase RlmCD [Paenibacillus sp. J2TS4]
MERIGKLKIRRDGEAASGESEADLSPSITDDHEARGNAKETQEFGNGKYAAAEEENANREESSRSVYALSEAKQQTEEMVLAKGNRGHEELGALERVESDNAGIIVHPTMGMDDPWRYRNKAQVPFGEEEGGLIGGFYAQGSHRIIDMDQCLIQHEQSDAVVARVKEIARSLGISAYDERAHTGLLRHVVVKYGFATGEIMVVLITNGRQIPKADEWVRAIRDALPAVKSICHNVNMARTNVIFGERTEVLWGQEYIHDYIGDVKFAISPRSFYQVNPAQTEVLYRQALEYAGLTGQETVIDAYCGIGTISLFLARHAKQVYGVEIVEDAVADARRNAALNGLPNVTFAAGKAEEVIPAWKQEGITADVIVVDPPRKGCDAALLETMVAMRPKRIVYVSCNPATLARDLRVLEGGGYRAVEAQPVDMFPHTLHVECVIGIQRIDT